MIDLWKIRAEIVVEPQDFPSGDTNGFMNIVTWAASAEAARQRIASYFEGFNWRVIDVEEAVILNNNFVADDDEFQDMIERARNNPDAIICGTFYSYKVN